MIDTYSQEKHWRQRLSRYFYWVQSCLRIYVTSWPCADALAKFVTIDHVCYTSYSHMIAIYADCLALLHFGVYVRCALSQEFYLRFIDSTQALLRPHVSSLITCASLKTRATLLLAHDGKGARFLALFRGWVLWQSGSIYCTFDLASYYGCTECVFKHASIRRAITLPHRRFSKQAIIT